MAKSSRTEKKEDFLYPEDLNQILMNLLNKTEQSSFTSSQKFFLKEMYDLLGGQGNRNKRFTKETLLPILCCVAKQKIRIPEDDLSDFAMLINSLVGQLKPHVIGIIMDFYTNRIYKIDIEQHFNLPFTYVRSRSKEIEALEQKMLPLSHEISRLREEYKRHPAHKILDQHDANILIAELKHPELKELHRKLRVVESRILRGSSDSDDQEDRIQILNAIATLSRTTFPELHAKNAERRAKSAEELQSIQTSLEVLERKLQPFFEEYNQIFNDYSIIMEQVIEKAKNAEKAKKEMESKTPAKSPGKR